MRVRPALALLAGMSMIAPAQAADALPATEAHAEADGMLLAQARYCGAPQDVGAALMAALQRRAQAASRTGAGSFDAVVYQQVVTKGFERMASTLKAIDAHWESEADSPSPQRVQQYIEQCGQVQHEVEELLAAADDDSGPSAISSPSPP